MIRSERGREGYVGGVAVTCHQNPPDAGQLLRASKAYHFPPKYTSHHALKSIGQAAGGTPISPKQPVQYREAKVSDRQNAMAKCM